MTAKIHIGTSGWHYKHWKGTFYPKDIKDAQQFSIYKSYFDTVEINNSFYRLPTAETFTQWHKASPDTFVFIVKASRFITHMKKLKGGFELTESFFKNVSALKEKLGLILFQLPPAWNLNYERFATFLKQLPTGYRYAFEFRNHTWYDEAVNDLLRKYNCAFCIYELAGHLSPLITTADFVYLRLHGPGVHKYEGSYSLKSLQYWSELCKDWAKIGKEVFVYFDNDQHGYAAFNALTLKDLIGQKVNYSQNEISTQMKFL